MKIKDLLDNFSWDNFKVIADELLNIDPDNLDIEMSTQPKLYSYYHTLMVSSKKNLADTTNKLEQVKALVRKNSKKLELTKKLTAKDLDDIVTSDNEVIQLSSEVNNLEFKYELLKGLVKALEHKKDMIIQISANKREETKLYSK